MKNFNLLLVLVSTLLILLVGSFAYLLSTEWSEAKVEQLSDSSTPIGWCGTSSYTSFIAPDERDYYIAGKELFKMNCAMCHHKNMKDPMTGPALGRAISRWDNDTLRMLKYINSPVQYFNEANDQRMNELHKKYNQSNKNGLEHLTFDELKSIIDYIEGIK